MKPRGDGFRKEGVLTGKGMRNKETGVRLPLTTARLTSAVAHTIIGVTPQGISSLLPSKFRLTATNMILAPHTKIPKPNMAMMATRCESGSFSLRTWTTGSTRMAMSMAECVITVPTKNLESSIAQVPGREGFQNFSMGMQWKIARKVWAKDC